jgi:hypothetical protein
MSNWPVSRLTCWVQADVTCSPRSRKREQDPTVLAELARGRLRAKLPQLRQALDGRVRDHHRLLITQILAHIEFEDALAAHPGAGD